MVGNSRVTDCCFMLECIDERTASEVCDLFDMRDLSTMVVKNVVDNCKGLLCTQDERFVYGCCAGTQQSIYDALSCWVHSNKGKIALIGVAQRRVPGDPYQLKLMETGYAYGLETPEYLNSCKGVFARYLDLCSQDIDVEHQLKGFIDLCQLDINEGKLVQHCIDWLYYIGYALRQSDCDKVMLLAKLFGAARAQSTRSESFQEDVCGANLLLRVIVHIIMYREMQGSEYTAGSCRRISRMSL